MAKKEKKSKPIGENETLAVYVHQHLELERGVKLAQVKLKALHKEASNNGAAPADMKEAIKFYKEDPKERSARMQRVGKFLEAIHAPRIQLDLFETSRPKPIAADVLCYKEGYYAAVTGAEPISTQYEAGSHEGQQWLKGYNDFLAALARYKKRFEDQGEDMAAETDEKDWPDDVAAARRKREQENLPAPTLLPQ